MYAGINALDPALLQMQQYKAAISSPPLPPNDPSKQFSKLSSMGNNKLPHQPSPMVSVNERKHGVQGGEDKNPPSLSLPPPLNPVTIPGTGTGTGMKSDVGLRSEGLESADVDDVGLLIDSDDDDSGDNHHQHNNNNNNNNNGNNTTIISTLPLSWSDKSKEEKIRAVEEGASLVSEKAGTSVENSDHWVLGKTYTARLKGEDSDGDNDDGVVDIEEGMNDGMTQRKGEDGLHHHQPPPPAITAITSSVRVMLVGEAVQQWLAQHPEDRYKVINPTLNQSNLAQFSLLITPILQLSILKPHYDIYPPSLLNHTD